MAHYLDTSALVKLVAAEPETAALRDWLLAGERDPVVSDLARTELLRATRRRDETAAPVARAVLEAMTLIPLPPATFDAASLLSPPELRSLDALHAAAALALGDDLEGFVTYDQRLARAAASNGLAVLSPGA